MGCVLRIPVPRMLSDAERMLSDADTVKVLDSNSKSPVPSEF